MKANKNEIGIGCNIQYGMWGERFVYMEWYYEHAFWVKCQPYVRNSSAEPQLPDRLCTCILCEYDIIKHQPEV